MFVFNFTSLLQHRLGKNSWSPLVHIGSWEGSIAGLDTLAKRTDRSDPVRAILC
jgi:hypothetical protein